MNNLITKLYAFFFIFYSSIFIYPFVFQIDVAIANFLRESIHILTFLVLLTLWLHVSLLLNRFFR